MSDLSQVAPAGPPTDDIVPLGQAGGGVTSHLGPAAREILETLAFALLIFFLIQAVLRNFKVEGSSMEPSIHDGQYIIVNRLVYRMGFPANFLRDLFGKSATGKKVLDNLFHSPQRGDVIVFIPPNNLTKDYIKRVIGLPGDRVEMRAGRMYINGQPLTETYILPYAASWGPATVGPGELFVLGDNRGGSSDSRVFGMLPMKNVIGEAWLVYWPPQHWGGIKHYDLGAQLAH